jgi:hypothetical protein
MRRITVVLLAALLTAVPVFAQLEVSGEVRTGFYMETRKTGDQDPWNTGGMKNNDGDSGTGEGWIRMDFRYTLENMGLRIRFQIDQDGSTMFSPTWGFAYAYGNLFNDQLTISAGILGESPWSTGGTELRRELETRESYLAPDVLTGEIGTRIEGLVGVRFEYKPSFLPGLNVGFVLNQPDQTTLRKGPKEQSFGEFLGESIVGAAYENDYFAVRVGYRFDSEADGYTNGNEGSRLVYRLEERMLKNRVEGMQIWLNGYYYGLGAELFEVPNYGRMSGGERFINWLYWLWDTENFITNLDVCFAMYQSYLNPTLLPRMRQEYQSIEIRPAFYYKFFNNFLQAGVRAGFGMELGPGKTYDDSFYQYFSVEPQIKFNIGINTYIALVYNFTEKYVWPDINGDPPIEPGTKSQKHSINLRAVYTF